VFAHGASRRILRPHGEQSKWGALHAWVEIYNTERPHESLGQVPPLTFLPRPDAFPESTFAVST